MLLHVALYRLIFSPSSVTAGGDEQADGSAENRAKNEFSHVVILRYDVRTPMLRFAPTPLREQAIYWNVALVAPEIGVSVQ